MVDRFKCASAYISRFIIYKQFNFCRFRASAYTNVVRLCAVFLYNIKKHEKVWASAACFFFAAEAGEGGQELNVRIQRNRMPHNTERSVGSRCREQLLKQLRTNDFPRYNGNVVVERRIHRDSQHCSGDGGWPMSIWGNVDLNVTYC